MQKDDRPLVMHVLHRFDTGGLENGVVNLVNRMPRAAYRHAIVALTEVTGFRERLQREDVECIALRKGSGHGAWLYPRLLRIFLERRPAVVHTRNLGPLEMQVAAAVARVPVRIHGEHGRELSDLDGGNVRLQRVRRLFSPFVHRYVALSKDLERYLVTRVGIRVERVEQIYNGVDAQLFHPAPTASAAIPGCPFDPDLTWRFGTVGRMQGVKNQTLLAQAFVRALELQPALGDRARLVMVGEGPLRAEAQSILDAAGVGHLAWLPGARSDVPEVMRGLDCFVLPSLAEGISNTILEAMATALPVIATRVGGNAELVADGRTGQTVASADVESMAAAMIRLASDRGSARAMGREGRAEVERRFSLTAMVATYQAMYDRQLALAGHLTRDH